MEVRFPAPPATSIKRHLRHKGFDPEASEQVWHQPLLSQTVMHAIQAVTQYNQNL